MPCALRIGVNALYLIPGGVGGTEIYLRNLLSALAGIDATNEYFLFLNEETFAAEPPLTPAAPNFRAVRSGVRAVHRPWRLTWEQVELPLEASRLRLDVLFSPGFTSPALCRCPKVTVIHDLQHRRQPQNFGRLELLAWRAAVWASARFSREIITVSENSRRDIVEAYGLAAERVHVIRHGVERELFDPPSGERPEPWPYLLSVSTIHPHKNWDRWLEAYARLASEGAPQHLVIAGLRGNYAEELEGLIEAKGLRDRVHPVGWIPREHLRELLKHADALVFPSTFEGFGMPVMEAMAAGVPVACSDIAPLREVARGAALLFDPYSAEWIAAAVRRLLEDPAERDRVVAEGRRRAAAFTWVRAAEQTLTVLRGAAR
jgi:glycosyltransferase involved in cell wall biosynthesis